MESLTQLYRIGRGPSSSHTIGPERIAEYVKTEYPHCSFKVELFSSLALTGKGHGTDRVLKEVLGDNTQIIFDTETKVSHPNTMDISVFSGENFIKKIRGESVGGGKVIIDGKVLNAAQNVYELESFEDIRNYVLKNGKRIYDYVFETEPQIKDYLLTAWNTMKACVEEGINAEGELIGGLHLKRKAKTLYNKRYGNDPEIMRQDRLLCAYALAVAEQNADNRIVVTAPTCGAAGVLAGTLYFLHKEYGYSDETIIKGLATAGILGNLAKTNASISGAECGCQAEVGVACAMAAGAIAEIYDFDIDSIECAAEIAIEHNLGLTCDPVNGLVQIPCIERNALATIKAFGSVTIAKSLASIRQISYDEILKTMYETGKDLNYKYRETSIGGLAKHYNK